MSIAHEGEPKANEWRKRYDAVIGLGLNTYTPTQAVVDSAQGYRLKTVDGKELIDFAAGVLVANLGHNHPLFEERYRHYAARLPRTAYNLIAPIVAEASERLVASMKANPKAQKVLWAASGSEGIQKAMWCAMHKHPNRPILAATRGGFHGKKGLAGDVTGETSQNPNVRFVSFPLDDDKPESFYRDELEALWKSENGKIALLITEPYLGAKGSFHPPVWYHKLLQSWCESHDIALIFDEVQACHGRTGNMYAFESYEIQPDLVVLGKGLANGEPAAAVVGRADLIDTLTYGEASDTFSATPRAAAAVCATFDVFDREQIVEHARRIAVPLREGLHRLKDQFPFVAAVRGEGLVYGIEMSDAETATRCVLEAYRGDGTTGVHFLGPLAQKVLRVSPPLIIDEAGLDQAFGMLETAWARVSLQAATF
ncbi:MAG: aspartate aminotransferase family protein [Candidatus Hydrogenedentota bacterium]